MGGQRVGSATGWREEQKQAARQGEPAWVAADAAQEHQVSMLCRHVRSASVPVAVPVAPSDVLPEPKPLHAFVHLALSCQH